MAKTLHNDVIDASLDKFATVVNITICTAEPANYAGIAALTLAAQVVTAGDGNGDFTIADGDTSGRKVTVTQQSSISITATGTATHIAYDDGSTLLGTTTCTSQGLTSGGTVTIPAHKLEVSDPA